SLHRWRQRSQERPSWPSIMIPSLATAVDRKVPRFQAFWSRRSRARICAQTKAIRAFGSRGRRNTSEIGRRCMLPPGREIRRRFWLQIRGGMLRDEAALSVGLDGATGSVWFRQAGGVTPPHLLRPRGRRYLSIAEREDILAGVER